MKYLFSGFIAGAILSILFFQGMSSSELYAGFYQDLSGIESLPLSDTRGTSDFFVLPLGNTTSLFTGDGKLAKRIEIGDSLAEFSGNGHYIIQYGKVGTSIELMGFNGERYWKKESREKPFLSQNGRIVLLLNGDHSKLRIFDTNGNPSGAIEISGRLCTSVEFSEKNDFSSCGFADGTYFFLDEKGAIINRGSLPAGNVVKGIRVSSNGKFGAVHYGTSEKDSIRVVNIAENESEDTELANVHVIKTAIHVADNGMTAIFDNDHILAVDDDCDEVFSLKVPAKRPGQARITETGDYYFLAYTKSTGESQLYIFTPEGEVFYAREFAGESYLTASVMEEGVIVRGSNSIFSYKIHVPEK